MDEHSDTIRNREQKFSQRLIERLAERGSVTLMRHRGNGKLRFPLQVLTASIGSKHV